MHFFKRYKNDKLVKDRTTKLSLTFELFHIDAAKKRYSENIAAGLKNEKVFLAGYVNCKFGCLQEGYYDAEHEQIQPTARSDHATCRT